MHARGTLSVSPSVIHVIPFPGGPSMECPSPASRHNAATLRGCTTPPVTPGRTPAALQLSQRNVSAAASFRWAVTRERRRGGRNFIYRRGRVGGAAAGAPICCGTARPRWPLASPWPGSACRWACGAAHPPLPQRPASELRRRWEGGGKDKPCRARMAPPLSQVFASPTPLPNPPNRPRTPTPTPSPCRGRGPHPTARQPSSGCASRTQPPSSRTARRPSSCAPGRCVRARVHPPAHPRASALPHHTRRGPGPHPATPAVMRLGGACDGTHCSRLPALPPAFIRPPILCTHVPWSRIPPTPAPWLCGCCSVGGVLRPNSPPRHPRSPTPHRPHPAPGLPAVRRPGLRQECW